MKFALATLLAFLAATAHAEDYDINGIKVSDLIARPTPQTARTGAGYLVIENTGDAADRLLAIEADFPRVMLHDTVMDGDVAKMEHMMSVPLAPGAVVSFAPGGKHVMFMGLNGDPFEVGETVPAVLVFENAGRLDVVFDVKEIDEAAHAGH